MAEFFESRLVTPPHVVTRQVDGELVLLNLENDYYFGLDPVGTRIWEVLSSSSSIGVGLEQLRSEFDVEGDRLRRDVERLVAKLVDDGLVELEAD
jgi:hypothetical protein